MATVKADAHFVDADKATGTQSTWQDNRYGPWSAMAYSVGTSIFKINKDSFALDTAWGTNGEVDTSGDTPSGEDIIVLAFGLDGSIYIATESNDDAVYKYDSDGALDTSWGTSGKYSIPRYDIQAVNKINKIIVDSSYNVYICSDGIQQYGAPRRAVAGIRKLDSNGAELWTYADHEDDADWANRTDADVVTLGYAVSGQGWKYPRQVASGVLNSAETKLYLINYRANPHSGADYGSEEYNMVKINTSDGSLDTSFGSNGYKNLAVSASNSIYQCYDVALDSDENIYTFHFSESIGGTNYQLTKLDSNGNIDTSWGTNGRVSLGSSVVPIRALHNGGANIAVYSDGRMAIACVISNSDYVVFLDANGNQSWDTGGFGNQSISGIAIDDDYVYISSDLNSPTSSGPQKTIVRWDVDAGTQDSSGTPTGAFQACTTLTSTKLGFTIVSGTQDRTLAFPQDWSHLEGETVQVLGDGNYLGTDTVSSGEITLDDNTTTNHVGLKYTSKIQPMKLDGEVNVKRIRDIILNVYETVGGDYGREDDNLYTNVLKSSGDVLATDGDLYSGLAELPFPGTYDRQGDIWITQDEPLPMNLIGMGVKYSQEAK